ncbi:O-antigen ligase family protein [Fluviicola sp.]|uniref:O-antigen ligase family protein n=1 Tax=Fluviicola sp. TaxID=1917219 RepID=UPI00261BD159|nr:O-antigen ligase family protein [Fluviicola sp.]
MIANTSKLNFVFIFLLIFTLIGGSHMVIGHVGGVEFSAYRFVLTLAGIYLLATKQLVCYTNRFSKYVFYVFLIWVLYGAISLLWTPLLLYGIKELFYLGVGLATYVVFLSFSRTESTFKRALEKIWITSFIAVIGFLLFEMLTQRHFEGEYLQKLAELGAFHKTNFIPIFTFINQNILGIYFCISMVLSGYFLLQNRNVLLNVAMILVALDFLLLTESRLGVLCMFLLLVMTLFLLVFKNIRSKIPLSFSRKQRIIILLIVGFNSFVIYSEVQFLESNTEFQFYEHENTSRVYVSLCEQLNLRVKEEGNTLLMSKAVLKQPDSSMKPDRVFAIEHKAYLKLLNNDSVELQLKRIQPELSKTLFMGNNGRLIMLLFLIFAGLIAVYLVSYRFEKYYIIGLVSCIGLFIIVLLPGNPYKYPFNGYKEVILSEPDSDTKKFVLTDLGVISADAGTGELLLKGGKVKTFLYSKKNQKLDNIVLMEALGSNSVRKNLLLNGLDYLKRSNYMGLGAGGFQASNVLKLNKYPDNGVVGAHNFIIEILSQYGVFIFALLMSVFIWIIYILLCALKRGLWDEKHFLVLWLLVTLVFMGNANSTFLSLPINWFLVVLVLVFANELMESRKELNENKH